MSVFLYACAAVCLLAAIQERRDVLRCVGFLLAGCLLFLFALL